MPKNIYFTTFLIAILIGIAIFYISEDIILSGILLGVFAFLSSVVILYYRHLLVLFLMFSVWTFLGGSIAFYDSQEKQRNTDIVDKYMGSYIPQQAQVREIYRRNDFYDEYLLEMRQVWQEKFPSGILSLLRVPKNFILVPGQIIDYQGKLYPLENFNGFEYKKYMLSKNIYFSSSTHVFDTRDTMTHPVSQYFFETRESLLSHMYRMYPKEEAIFLWGILLWARENIPQDLKEDFNNSWLTHFIAVSGFNITLCIIFIKFLFWFLPPSGRICMVSLTIIWFSFFVGLWAPVVRAAIMWILWYIFLESWTKVQNMALLAFTAVCMSIFSPLILLYDVSFHLSFLAVIWIIYTQKFFKKYLVFLPEFFAVREAWVLTLAALVFTLPIMIFQFGQISLLAPIANIAVTWSIPFAMFFWALSLIAEIFSGFLWSIIWYIAFLFLSYDIAMVRFFWNIDSALLKTDFGVYTTYLQVLYFIFFTYIVARYHMQKKHQP